MHGSVNHDNEVKVSVKYQYLYDLVKNLGVGGKREILLVLIFPMKVTKHENDEIQSQNSKLRSRSDDMQYICTENTDHRVSL